MGEIEWRKSREVERASDGSYAVTGAGEDPRSPEDEDKLEGLLVEESLYGYSFSRKITSRLM